MSSQSRPDPDVPNPLHPEGSSNGDWLRLDSSPEGAGARRPFDEPNEQVPFPNVPGYEILGHLGRGGMGVVFKARHIALKRLVALKMISGSHFSSDESKERFRTEAEELARLQHSNIVQIYDVGEVEGRPFLALEYLDGGTLGQWMTRLPPSPHQTADILEPLARAIQHAHDHGVVHRDLKPGNILLGSPVSAARSTEPESKGSEINKRHSPGKTGATQAQAAGPRTPKIVDFGLVKRVESQDDPTQNRSGMIVGTPQYMAPEQATGSPAAGAPSVDVYALGAILYEMLTGHPPFEGGTAAETLFLLQTQEPVPPRRLRPKIPRDLETISLKCLEKDPSRRYASAADLADDLKRFLSDEPILARAVGPLSRLLRWRRRNRAVAYLLALVAVPLLGLAVFGPAAALHYSAMARFASAEREQAARERDEATRQARDNQIRLVHVNEMAARLSSLERDPGKSLLFFANAARLARMAGDRDRDELNRVCFHNWMNRVCLPVHALAALPPDSPPPRAWAFHPSGRWLLVQTRNRVHLWDMRAEQELPLSGNVMRATSAVWSPDGETLALGLDAGDVLLCRFPFDGSLPRRVTHTGPILALRFDDSGKRLALGGIGARVWDFESKTFTGASLPHPGLVMALTFDQQGNRLATGCSDGKARVFEIGPAASPVLSVPWRIPSESTHTKPLLQPPLFAMNGTMLICLHPDQRHVEVWDVGTKELYLTFPPSNSPFEWRVDCCDSLPGDRLLALGGPAGARVIDLTAKQNVVPWPEWFEPTNHVFSVSLDPDSGGLMTGGTDLSVRLWSRNGAAALHALPAFGPVVATAILQGGRLFVTMEDNGSIRAWSPPRVMVSHFQVPRLSPFPCVPIPTPDGKHFLTIGTPAIGSTVRTSRAYEAETGLPAGPILQANGAILCAALAPSSEIAALAISHASTESERLRSMFGQTPDMNFVQLLNWRTGNRLLAPVPMPTEPRSLAFSLDGSRLAVLCAAGEIVLIDSATGKIVAECANKEPDQQRADRSLGGALRFSPDGRFIVAWGLDSTLRILDAAECKHQRAVNQGEGTFTQIEFVSGSDMLLAAHDRRDVACWDLSTGDRLTNPAALPQTDGVRTLRLSADRRTLITAGREGQARLWDWKSGKQVCPPMHHTSEIINADFLPGDRWMFTARLDGVVRLWDYQSGLPVSPSPNLNTHRCQSAVLAAAGRVALVGGSDGAVYGHDLTDLSTAALFAAATGNGDDRLTQAAQLISGFELATDSIPASVGKDAWLRKWRDHRAVLNNALSDPAGEYRAALRHQAERFEKQHYWTRAEQCWNDILQIDSDDFEARMARGRCAAEQGVFSRGIADQTEVILLAPRLIEARSYRAVLFARTGRSVLAFADFDRLLRQEPNHVLGLTHRGELFGEVGRFDDARRDLQKAADLGADDVSTWFQLGVSQARSGDKGGYQSTCQRAWKRFGSSTAFAARWNLARLLLLGPDPGLPNSCSVELLQRCCEEQPGNAIAQYVRAYALARAGRTTDAEKVLADAAKSISGEPPGWVDFVRALVRLRLGDPGARQSLVAASEWLERAERGLAKNPDLTLPNSWPQREELRLMRQWVEAAVSKP